MKAYAPLAKQLTLLPADSLSSVCTSSTHSNSSCMHTQLLQKKYIDTLKINPDLTRSLVSFQANKRTPFFRWLKYKESFSEQFVLYILKHFKSAREASPRVLDPFAGVGTTITTATRLGWQATAIEMMPVGIAAMRARLMAETVDVKLFHQELQRFRTTPLRTPSAGPYRFPHLRITEKAFPPNAEAALSAYMKFLDDISEPEVRTLFWFAALCILEDISFTRKDGQYLRWDCRSGKNLGSRFRKARIEDFSSAILNKLGEMEEDLKNNRASKPSLKAQIIEGSCLDYLPSLPREEFDLVITSPPYCNRYDYTRTYALELAFLGYQEDSLRNLRQNLLSATVENRAKATILAEAYAKRGQRDTYDAAVGAFQTQAAFQAILGRLDLARQRGELNNPNIVSMVEQYFFEMNLVIRELARVLRPSGYIVMVNDNVQYHGQEIPVDLILSDFAAAAGLQVEVVWVLPRGKGNSSQQMGVHGRKELRKCVYIWRKPERSRL